MKNEKYDFSDITEIWVTPEDLLVAFRGDRREEAFDGNEITAYMAAMRIFYKEGRFKKEVIVSPLENEKLFTFVL